MHTRLIYALHIYNVLAHMYTHCIHMYTSINFTNKRKPIYITHVLISKVSNSEQRLISYCIAVFITKAF